MLAAAVTDSERRQVQILRELDAKRRAGPFWTGTKEDWARIDSMSGRNAVYNPFECANGSGKRGVKRQFKMVDLKTIKLGVFNHKVSLRCFLLAKTRHQNHASSQKTSTRPSVTTQTVPVVRMVRPLNSENSASPRDPLWTDSPASMRTTRIKRMGTPTKTTMTQTAATATPKKARTSMPSLRTMFSTRMKMMRVMIIMLKLTLMAATTILRRAGVGSMGMMCFDLAQGVRC